MEVAGLVSKLYSFGKAQYDDFVQKRLDSEDISLFAPVNRNKFSLVANRKSLTVSKLKSKVVVRDNCLSCWVKMQYNTATTLSKSTVIS